MRKHNAIQDMFSVLFSSLKAQRLLTS